MIATQSAASKQIKMNPLMKFVIASFAVCLVQSAAVEKPCNGACPKIFLPVCGIDNTGNYKTFSNKCIFEYEQCSNRGAEWRLTAEERCESITKSNDVLSTECNNICTLDYTPVCGMDNTGRTVTFGNKCMFEQEQCNNRGAGWKLAKETECDGQSQTDLSDNIKCPQFCTFEYRPVCGMDNTGNQRTFGNKCSFEVEQCNNRGVEWRLVNEHECESQTETADEINDEVCPSVCTYEYVPVCGLDNTGNLKTFGNKCTFEVEQCNNRGADWRIIKHSECSDDDSITTTTCLKKCTREYNPICGSDNTGNLKTFNNECEFEVEQCENRGAEWRIVSNQDCRLRNERSSDNVECPLICPLLYRPVCGVDNTGNMKTFDNQCQFKTEECQNRGAEWRIVSQQDCRFRAQQSSEICPLVCPLVYAPVCGADNTGNLRTFQNECMFKTEQCQNRGAEWKLISKQDCRLRLTDDQQCPTACPLLLAPVCGSDNTGNLKTFSNECQFQVEQCQNRGAEWKLISKQDCRLRSKRSVENTECFKPCTRELKPVCGADNTGNVRTFSNECEFKNEQCDNRGAEWKLIAKQDCRLRLTDDQQCPTACPLLFAPVCGSDNTGNLRTFSNECQFQVEQCQNRGAEWKLINKQDCRLRSKRFIENNECLKPCTRELKPVCGADNTGNVRTFSNECEFKNEQCDNRGAEWKLIAKQDCRLRLTDDQQCPTACPLLFAPVCGSDNTGNLRTFSNECQFQVEQCQNRGAEWKLISKQDCRLRNKRSAESTECPKVCTRELMPVCGADNTGNYKTFSNECMFKTAQCENRGAEWKLISKQDCRLRLADDQQCPTACPLLFAPVCGADNTGNLRTFSNECQFQVEQCENRGAEWKLIAKQDCRLRLADDQQCPTACPLLFAPVCGADNTGNLRTFSNECQFEVEQCENRGAEWKIVSHQDCRLRN